MAYIKFDNENVQRYHNDDYMPEDYWIENISDDGVAQVKQSVADNLAESDLAVAHYEGGSE
jgi:hypothetical protein